MSTRSLAVVVSCISVLLLAACVKLESPGEEVMLTVFTADTSHKLAEPQPPADVPTISVADLEDWRPICNQCHQGPNYSSLSILNWGHRASCLSQTTCNRCHAEQLHRSDVRGDKAMCIECHQKQKLAVECKTCHPPTFVSQIGVHEPEFLGSHGKHETWQNRSCLVCHGTKQWCFACHGIDMPHPRNFIKIHHTVVAGRPEVCHNCHGSQSCTRCHKARGVTAVTE